MRDAVIDAQEAHEWTNDTVGYLAYACPTCKDEVVVPDYCERPRCDTCAEAMEAI